MSVSGLGLILQFSHKTFHRTSKGRVYYGFIVRPSF